jgi:hypothetical protein
MFENRENLSKWLRVLLVPGYPGNTVSPEFTYAEPQLNIEGAQWITGENDAVYNMSAVAYFFADDLINTLDMPVGILNASLGGSAIASWLSRDAIDGDEKVKKDIVSDDDYIELSEWKTTGQDVYSDMTANYNHKIEALGKFRPSGMIWYQGESDIGRSAERYINSFDLMQRSYSEHFGYEDELMPIVFSQLASYIYSDVNEMLIGSNGAMPVDRVLNRGKWYDIHKNDPMYYPYVMVSGPNSAFACQPIWSAKGTCAGLFILDIDLQKLHSVLGDQKDDHDGLFFIADVNGQTIYCNENDYADWDTEKKNEYQEDVAGVRPGTTKIIEDHGNRIISQRKQTVGNEHRNADTNVFARKIPALHCQVAQTVCNALVDKEEITANE